MKKETKRVKKNNIDNKKLIDGGSSYTTLNDPLKENKLKSEIIRILVIMFILLFSAFVFSCSAESVEQDCECVKETYEIEQFVCYGQSGLPQLCFDKIVLESENVNCQSEYDNVENANGTYTRVVCD